MNRTETARTIMLLHAAYPQFYRDISEEEARAVMNLWAEMFRDENVEVVRVALYSLIRTHGGFPPTIADVCEEIRKLKEAFMNEPTDEELWKILRAGIMDGKNGAREHFEKFPPILKAYCGSPGMLEDYAEHEMTTLDTVDKALFMKQISVLREREKSRSNLPQPARNVLNAVRNGSGLIGAPEGGTPSKKG